MEGDPGSGAQAADAFASVLGDGCAVSEPQRVLAGEDEGVYAFFRIARRVGEEQGALRTVVAGNLRGRVGGGRIADQQVALAVDG